MKDKKDKKKHDLCVISMENRLFRCTQRAITQRRVITLGPIFIKMVLNRGQGLNLTTPSTRNFDSFPYPYPKVGLQFFGLKGPEMMIPHLAAIIWW